MLDLNYRPYGHGDAETEPAGDETANIIGLELEIANTDYDYSERWNEAIDEGLLETADSGSAYIQLEEEAQGNVDYELIFNADDPELILERLNEVNTYISGTFRNHRECSAHVHLNRYYVQSVLGLDQIDIYRATEAIAPLIYAVSGRSYSAWNRWSPSHIAPEDNSPLQRLKRVDEVEPNTRRELRNPYSSSARYECCNVQNSKTIEIRGFSNYYDNSERFIELYIKIARELIPEIAGLYHGKSYYSNPEPLFKAVNVFLDDNPLIEESFNINGWRNYQKELQAHKRALYDREISIYQAVQANLNRARQCADVRPLESAQHVLEALKLVPELTPNALNLEDIVQTIDELEQANQKRFKNAIWRI